MRRGSPDVAIIGIACIFPSAPDVLSFWENILGKVSAIADPPADWGTELVYDPSSTANDRIYTSRGGYLGELATFSPLKYGLMPVGIDGAEPEHFLALRVAHEALGDAGYLEKAFDRTRTTVILGRGTYVNRGYATVFQHAVAVDQAIRLLRALHPEHSEAELEALKQELKAGLPPFNAETAPGLVPSVMCGRIANRLDLMGPAYSVDAACASSLIAVDLAMTDLISGKADLALAGGVQASTTFPIMMVFSQLGALSRRGEVRPFQVDADGTLLGEGVAVLVLKRRDDAERDGDRIYAVIKAVGTASDGRALGVLAPRVEGEELAMRRAYEAATFSPETIGLVEAHGTATPVGDRAELEALARVFGGRKNGLATCALGSVKSMIGHTIPAAGAAGMIKAALALYHKVLPPTLNTEKPSPLLEGTPFYLNDQPRPWISAGLVPRRAAVSAFGFGGINAHAILEEHVDMAA
jgi:acyl transferase domain-containing protein